MGVELLQPGSEQGGINTPPLLTVALSRFDRTVKVSHPNSERLVVPKTMGAVLKGIKSIFLPKAWSVIVQQHSVQLVSGSDQTMMRHSCRTPLPTKVSGKFRKTPLYRPVF